ncbi:class I SAM-dependent methyltransferase [Desulfoprunum benzoelyticum]|uniref:Ribosomal RNA small subunit methyltransferase J n=1 Tax=Desulfoprunum benzoelyticum TaxID=1506996 RepID=A0A840UYT9_9BACT|nr:class I SAM-dependent methyltransferase [Desulfoprunum benzoelyticum]MBB5346609.1 16S rRNA (guanine1516-N2)-methyltransferase [Desulfoprunum benzoelyticum]MBM9529145.1 class I SAM-dependent methyltransferase [Desulfoprunum benzoelyticum]
MHQKAEILAKKLGLPCTPGPAAAPQLVYTERGLELRLRLGGPDTVGASVLHIDFSGGRSGYRHARNCTIKQPLARAIGIRPGVRPTVFDATAGMGADAFVLACLGCRVTMNERSPVVGALLADAIERAMQAPEIAAIFCDRIDLIVGDARSTLQTLSDPPETIYLDPMYPHGPNSALNSKEMRMIRAIVGDDVDGPELLAQALLTAAQRVVVKRPKGAPLLHQRPPSHQVLMKNSRFDVYLRRHL